jgi:hypothetical protein
MTLTDATSGAINFCVLLSPILAAATSNGDIQPIFQAYVAWVNSQLRKRANLPLVVDLRNDLQSGVLLAQLVEIICAYTIPASRP